MRKLAGIAAIAGAIRLATGISAVLAAAIIGGVAVAAAAYGLWTHRRFQLRSWLTSWGVLSLGLVAVVAGAAMEGVGHTPRLAQAVPALVLTLVGDALAIAGLCLLIHWRMPGRASAAFTTAVVSALALWFALLSLVVVPGHGWHPGSQLPSMAVPALEFVMVALTGSLMAMSEKHPVAYRYLMAGFSCLFVCHAVNSALFLAGRSSSPVPLDALSLWGACLWGGSVLHPSQRVSFEPVPLRSGRPTWPHVVLLLAATLVVPGTLLLQSVLGLPSNKSVALIGSALLPALVVGYLLHQVFARSAAEYRAQHDALTGVCNRVLFSDSLSASLIDAGRNDRGLAVMFLDLDRFK
ncbi:MAG TPA: diguanylate cyclase, partial [Acidimicrobiales bacterium]|nr:diguanylate cyclase [Acidimicrobiales bacterium]